MRLCTLYSSQKTAFSTEFSSVPLPTILQHFRPLLLCSHSQSPVHRHFIKQIKHLLVAQWLIYHMAMYRVLMTMDGLSYMVFEGTLTQSSLWFQQALPFPLPCLATNHQITSVKVATKVFSVIWPLPPLELDYQDPVIKELKASNQKPCQVQLIYLPN